MSASAVLCAALFLAGCAGQPAPRVDSVRILVPGQEQIEIPRIAEQVGSVLARHSARAFLREAKLEGGQLDLVFEGSISDEVKGEIVARLLGAGRSVSPTGPPDGTVVAPAPPVRPAPSTPTVAPIDVPLAEAAARRVMPSVVLLTGMSQGTGFVVSADGYILTNAHVARTLSQGPATAQFHDGRTFPVRVIGYVESLRPDIGVVKIEATGLTAVEFADASTVRPNDPLVVVGHPGGYGYWLVTGGRVISASRMQERSSETSPLIEYAQLHTEVPSSEGSSGSPFVDANGKVVGILAGPLPTEIVEPSPAPLRVLWTWKEFLALGRLGSYGIGSEDALKYMRDIIARGGNLP